MRNPLAVFLLCMVALFSQPAVAESSKAINFHFTDINGKTVKLSDFRGKWLLVNFWAPWCPLCWIEVPTLNELNKRKDFAVIGIGLDYGPDESVIREAATRHNLDFHAIVAGGARRNMDSPFRQVGPVDFYPTSYLYDPSGEIVMFIPGQVRLNKILAFMEEHRAKSSSTQVVERKTKESSAAGATEEVTFSSPAPGSGTQKKKSPSARPVNPRHVVTY
jgi:thiol-disulfide isomerase/thioredoxin